MNSRIRRLQRLAKVLRLAGPEALRAEWADQRAPRDRGPEAELRTVRIPGCAAPIRFRLGTSDWQVIHQVFFSREYDMADRAQIRALERWYRDALARGRRPLIVDCGGNIGCSAIWLATRWPEAQVVAVEPSAESFALLARNVESYANIRAVHAAISDRRAYVRVADEGRQPWGVRTQELEVGDAEDGEPSGPAPDGMACSVTVPDLVAACPDAELFIIKIDIEGFERELFRSNHAWADAAPLVVFEPHDWMIPFGGTGHAVFSALAGAPRDYLMRGENVFAFSAPLLKPFAEG